ncbi:MAG: hypothetical protein K0S78_4122 [Thermomicrobiales bacterium]|nr:hypothetical protein [Thermomicrobiales bacterium]
MSRPHFTLANFRWDASGHRLRSSFCLETSRVRHELAAGNDDRCSADTNVSDATSLPLHLDRDIAPAIDRVPLLSNQHHPLARRQQAFPVEVDRGCRMCGARDRILRDAIGGCEVTQVDEADRVFRFATDKREAPVTTLLAVRASSADGASPTACATADRSSVAGSSDATPTDIMTRGEPDGIRSSQTPIAPVRVAQRR